MNSTNIRIGVGSNGQDVGVTAVFGLIKSDDSDATNNKSLYHSTDVAFQTIAIVAAFGIHDSFRPIDVHHSHERSASRSSFIAKVLLGEGVHAISDPSVESWNNSSRVGSGIALVSCLGGCASVAQSLTGSGGSSNKSGDTCWGDGRGPEALSRATSHDDDSNRNEKENSANGDAVGGREGGSVALVDGGVGAVGRDLVQRRHGGLNEQWINCVEELQSCLIAKPCELLWCCR